MDLKIKDVSELLSISEATIKQWVAEGKIPAYQMNREYRFSRAEIEDWLMQQKLESAEWNSQDELKTGNLQFSLYRAVFRGDVLHIAGKTKAEIIHATMNEMAKRFDLDADVLTELFLDRERLMPTTLGHGIGVPHTRDFLLDTHYDVMMVVYPKEPIEYGALDGEKVDLLFFLFACEDKHHLNLLAKVAHLNVNEKNRAFLRTQPNKEQLLEFLKSWETSLKA